MQTKEATRAQYKSLYEAHEVADYEVCAFDVLRVEERFMQAKQVLAYAPRPIYEIDFLSSIMDTYPEKAYFFPKTAKNGTMQFYRVYSQGELIQGRYGIREPLETVQWDASHIAETCAFVPALAVTPNGVRLGWGKGCYDKFIGEHRTLTTLCVVPDFASASSLPIEPHDIPVTKVFVVTKD